MVLSNLITKFRLVVVAFATAPALFSATPAIANSAAAAVVAAPLRTAQAARPSALGSGDAEFRNLFANWQALDKSASLVATTVRQGRPAFAGSVTIPSRMPVDNVRLSSSYGMRTHPVIGGRRAHNGVDLAAPTGTPIYATADGTVSKAEWYSSYGLYVALEHGGEIQTRYAHMSRLNVYEGQQLRKGDVIGYVGSTGRSTGPHLHYEVRVAGASVNPLPYMQGEYRLAANPASAIGGN